MKTYNSLIVDDSAVMRKIVEKSLRQAGLPLTGVVEAANGIEGLSALEDYKPDIILSDINMPAMDGLEFVKQLQSRAEVKNIPVVMITTESSEAHVRQAIENGARSYIRKPFTAEQVRDRILPLLER